ncbi:MAG: MFS transporter, partial [SAR202 cluster bacterium]|nr:MFS transporter [SAR202 cluster bacterium]
QVAAIVAPLVAGSMLDSVNPSWVYAFIAIAGAFAIVSLLPVKYVKAKVEEQHAPLRELREGLVYVLKTPMVRTLLLLALVTEMFGWSHEFLLPVMAEDILEVGASGLGYLLSTAAAGAVVATLAVSSVRDIRRRGRVLVLGAMGFGLVLVAFSFSRWFPLSLVLLALAYGAAVSYETVLSTVIQTSVPSGMRGRVSSLQTATWGLTGVGGFVMGAIGSVLTVPIAIAIGGGLVAVNAARMLPMTSRFDARKAEQPASSTSPAL